MHSLNKVLLIGNNTADITLKETDGKNKVANFSIATNRSWNTADGQVKEKAEYHNIVAWNNLAEIVSKYLKKGHKAYIEGRLETSSWEGEDGKKRYKTEIVASNIILLSPK